MVGVVIGTWSGVARRSRRWRHGSLGAPIKYGVDYQFLYKRPKTVFWTVHVAMSIALPGLVATAMTLQHMDLIAMQFEEGIVTQIF